MKNLLGICLSILFFATTTSHGEIQVPNPKFGEEGYEFGKSDYKKSFMKFAFKRGFGHCTYPKGECDTSKICGDEKKLTWCRKKCGHKIDIDKVLYEYCVKPKELEEKRKEEELRRKEEERKRLEEQQRKEEDQKREEALRRKAEQEHLMEQKWKERESPTQEQNRICSAERRTKAIYQLNKFVKERRADLTKEINSLQMYMEEDGTVPNLFHWQPSDIVKQFEIKPGQMLGILFNALKDDKQYVVVNPHDVNATVDVNDGSRWIQEVPYCEYTIYSPSLDDGVPMGTLRILQRHYKKTK